MSKFLVTVEEFSRFVDADGYHDERLWSLGGFGTEPAARLEAQLERPNRPMVGVSWYEAQAYCAWLGGRLPTEAEWELAARGPSGRRFPWGDDPPEPERVNFDESLGCESPVGIYPAGATEDGVMDLAGNVWEWVADWYALYTERNAIANDPSRTEGRPGQSAPRRVVAKSGELPEGLGSHLCPTGRSVLELWQCRFSLREKRQRGRERLRCCSMSRLVAAVSLAVASLSHAQEARTLIRAETLYTVF